jgi:hypothetical protein
VGEAWCGETSPMPNHVKFIAISQKQSTLVKYPNLLRVALELPTTTQLRDGLIRLLPRGDATRTEFPVSTAVASPYPCMVWSYTASTGSRPSSIGSLIVFRTTSLGFTAMAYHLEMFLPRSLMCLRQV